MILHNPIVSGSLTFAPSANFVANNGSVSGSAQIISLLPSGVVSGSTQISLSGFDTDNLGEGSSNLYYTDTRVKTKLNADTVISGSSQVDVTATTNYGSINQYTDSDFDTRLAAKSTANLSEGSNLYYTVSRVKLKLDQDGVISGSSQLTSTFDTRYLNAVGDGVISGSSQISLAGFNTSNLSENTNLYYTDARVKTKLNTDGVISGSTFSSPSQGTVRATINGSNTDIDTGLQTADSPQFSNLTLTGNLTVAGSTTTTTSNEVNIGDNIINLNYGGSSTTGGIYVKDGTGVSQVSGSLLWDSTDGKDYWKLGKLGSESEVITTSNIVTELPSGTVSGSSQITITESQISDLDKYTDADAKTKLNAETVISGSSQVVLNDAIKTGFDTDDVSEGSSNVYYTDARVKTKLNAEGAISSSSQLGINNNTITFTAGNGLDGGGSVTLNQNSDETITFTASDGVVSGSSQIITLVGVDEDNFVSNSATKFPSQQSVKAYVDAQVDTKDALSELSGDTDDVSEGSSNLYYTDARVKTKLNSETVISGSSQVNADSITNFDSNVKTKLNAETVISGSDQVDYNSIQNQPTTITNTQASNITTNNNKVGYTDALVKTKLNAETVISGSSQVDYDNIQNQPTTISSTQASNITTNNNKVGYTDSLVKTKLNAETVISGSSQVNADSITNFDTNVKAKINADGVISGSDQVDYQQLQNQPTTISSAQATKLSNISISQGVNLDTIESNVATNNSKVGYTDSLVKTKLNADTVISGSSQITITESQISDLDKYTDSDFDTRLAAKSTTNLSEGSNKYYTDARVKTKLNSETVISGSSQVDVTATTNYGSINQYTDSDFDTRLAAKSTTNLAEGTNLYYTDARVKTKLNSEEVVSGSYIATLDGTNLVSGSSQITLSSVSGYDADEHFTQNSIVNLGTVTSGDIIQILPSGTISGSSQVSIALSTQTTGNYVGALGTGTGLTIGSNSGEGSTPTLAVDYGSSSNTAVQGNVGLEIQGTTDEIDVSNGSITLGSGGTATIGLANSIAGNRTFQNNVTITGNLVVNGDTTSASTTNTTISDKLIELGNGTTGSPAGDSGIVIERGDSNNGFIGFDESADKFIVGTGTFNGSSTGDLAITKGTLLANVEGTLVGNVTGQVSDLSNLDTDNLSEGSSNLYFTNTRVQSYIRSIDVISGSSQITGLTASQLSDNDITINSVEVELGGSITFAQLSQGSGTISGSAQLTSDFDNRYLNTNGDGIISESAQVNYNSIQNKPTTITSGQASAITANTAKETNVSTNLSISGTTGARTIESSDGNNAIIPIATTSVSGLLSPGLFDEIDDNTAKVGYTDALVKLKLDGDGVISGSTQLLSDLDGRYLEINGDGVFSGSAQVDYDSILNQPTIPAAASNATITLTAGTDLGTGGNFTTNQSSNETITINHSNITRTDTTSTNSPDYGETFTAIDSVTTSARGHVTAVNVKTLTLPSTDDTSYDLSVQAGASNTSIIRLAGSDSTNDDVTISGGTGITIAESGNTITITGTAQYGDSDVKDKLNEETVISGSSQISLSGFSTTNLSEGTNKYYTDARVKTKLNTEGVISGSASQGRSFLNVDVAGTDNSTDVTLGNTNYLSISGQAITGGTVPIGSGGTGATSVGAARTALGVDAAGTDNSTNVTIASGKDYITISGQELTLGSVDASSDISNLNTSNVSEGTRLYYTDARVKTKLNTETVISGSAGILAVIGVDEDNFSSNSATKFPTQQSVKAYVDSKAQAQDNTDELTEGSTNLFYTDARVKTKINADGVVSGSNSEVKSFLSIAASDVSDFDTEVSNNSSVAANTLKVSDINHNVSTNLSEGTATETTVNVNSSDGNNATLVSASTSRAGLLTKAKFDEIVANTLKVSDVNHNVSTDLSKTTSTTNVTINSSDGNNVAIGAASSTAAGVLTSAKLAEIEANTLKTSDINHNVSTDLSEGTSTETTVDVNSSDGTNATLESASTSRAGLLSKAKFDEIVANTLKNTNVSTNLSKTVSGTGFSINSSDGNNVALTLADTSNWGLMSDEMFDKLDGIEASADVNRTDSQIKTSIGTGNGNFVPSEGTSGHFLKHDGTFGLPSYTTDTNLSTEEVQDIVGAMFSGNTETRISATYVDGDGTIDLVVNDMTANDNDDVSVANLKTRLAGGFGSNAVQIGDSTDTITIPGNLTVQGSQTINNVTLIETSNGVVFEGTTADAHETTLIASDPSTDRTITLPNKSGTVAMTSDITGTNSGTNTGDETTASINALDITEVGTISSGVWQGSAISTTYLSGQSGTNTGDETLSSVNSLGITTLGTIGTGVWQGTAINQTYLVGQSGTNTGDETKTSINALDITEVGTISSGVWQGSVIADAYLSTNTAHLSGTQTFSGAKTFSSAVNIDSTTPSTTKTTGALIVDGGVGIAGALNVGGDVVAYASSDERLKDNIELISNPIEKVQSLKGVTWDWNDNADELQQSLPNVGVIAQDVEKVLPQLVTDRDSGFKGVDYAKLTGLLIEAIKDQQKQIDELKSKLS